MDEHLPPTRDLDLLVKRLPGDRSTRDELFRRAYGQLRRLAHTILEEDFSGLRRWLTAEDVLHDALIRLLRALPEVQPACWDEFFALAATEIRREFLDRARQCAGPRWQCTHQAAPAARGNRQPPELEVADPAEGPCDLDDWSALHQEIERLPARERKAVMLTLYCGWTAAQIAERTQVTERTVEHWLQSAGRELRCHLSDG
jgi:RNA polymerase sigma factor (sigma-70 family)